MMSHGSGKERLNLTRYGHQLLNKTLANIAMILKGH